MTRSNHSRTGFTLIEVILVLGIILMFIVILVPGLVHSSRRNHAKAVRYEMKLLDKALHQYALQTGKKTGAPATFEDLKKYLDPQSRLVKFKGRDSMGNPFGAFVVDTPIKVPAQSARSLDSVADPAFWADYK